MSENDPVNLAGIPVFTGDLALLDTKVTALTKGGEAISTAAGDVHSSFGGLQAFYKAPEADQLFATTKPVADRGESLKSELATVAGALSTYSDEAYPLVEKLKELKRDAGAFLVKANADDKWREDGDLVDENNHRHDEIRETWTAFQAVERACHDKIVALVGGHALKVDDGSGKAGTYGYDAEALKHAKGLPWGDPVEESKPWWHIHEHAWDFAKGFFVDGVWGTIKGLGTLVGTDGWDSAKQAWSGLGKLATGLALSNPAMGGFVFWSIPDEKLPAYLRESRAAVKETGKALVAWDKWGENPSRAAGAVTFNVLTTVFTGGAGGAASGAGKAAIAAKALSTAGKVGRFVDPMTYVFKGVGMGVTKVSDVIKGLRGARTAEVIPLPEGAISLPDGAFKLADGTLHLPEGAAVPEGAFEIPSNSVKLPDGVDIPAGAIDLGDGVVRLPEGMTPPAGTLNIPEGALKLPHGTTALPESAVPLTDVHGNTIYADGPGNLLKEDGTLLQHHTAAQRENPAAGAEAPSSRTPSPQPALVGAHTGVDASRLSSDITGPVRTVDNGAPGAHPDTTPGSAASDNMPRNESGNSPRGDQSGSSGAPLSADIHHSGSRTSATHSDGRPSGGTGSDRSGSGVDTTDNAAPHGGASDDATGGTRNSDEVMSPERLKELQQKHVELANTNEAWRLEHYNTLGRRKRIVNLVDGVELPQLTLDANGKWISVHDLPNGPREARFNPKPLDKNSVPDGVLPDLDKVAGDRRVSTNLNNAELKLREADTAAHREDVRLARAAYDARLPGVPNNSKIPEALGNRAATLHVIPREFPLAEVIDLPKTPNGANMFDGAYKLPGGERLLVEEKAPSNDPDWRQGKADPDPLSPNDHGGAQGLRVQQGTRPYIRTILAEMTSRGGRDAEIAADLRAALKSGKLRYVLVKAMEDVNGLYGGAVIDEFKI
ncbi:hypothetical protein ACFVW8_13145 [Streptomyces sp. NPDC058221]|uniref:hypothetical protein n=1 Tax=Streptomyces sp. NPDC058221 TaxID=3346388 RepID=UPI0036EB5061